jgi:hypothetical protein
VSDWPSSVRTSTIVRSHIGASPACAGSASAAPAAGANGQPGHQSARYTIEVDGADERQSSSGVIVSTGTGATGWCRSIARIQAPTLPLPSSPR